MWLISHSCFSVYSSKITTSCFTFSFAAFWSPQVTLIGDSRMSYAKNWIYCFIVAVNNRVWRSGRVWETIDLIWCSKPKESILSASSRTRYVTRCVFVAFFFIISINLPGEAMRISTPALNIFHCSCLFYPPSKQPIRS